MTRLLAAALLLSVASPIAAQPDVLASIDLSGDASPFARSGLTIQASAALPDGMALAAASRDSLYVARVGLGGLAWTRAFAIDTPGARPAVSLHAVGEGLAVGLAFEAGLSGLGLRLDADGHEWSRTPLSAGFPDALRNAPGLPEPWRESTQGVYGLADGWLVLTEGRLTAVGPDSTDVAVGGLSAARVSDAGETVWETPLIASPGLDLYFGPQVFVSPTTLVVGLETRMSAQGVHAQQVAIGAVDLATGTPSSAFPPVTVTGEEAAQSVSIGADADGAPLWHTTRTTSETDITRGKNGPIRSTTHTQSHTLHRAGVDPITWTAEIPDGGAYPSYALCTGSAPRQLVGQWSNPHVTLALRDLGTEAAPPVPFATFDGFGSSTFVRVGACAQGLEATWALVDIQNVNRGTVRTFVYALAP